MSRIFLGTAFLVDVCSSWEMDHSPLSPLYPQIIDFYSMLKNFSTQSFIILPSTSLKGNYYQVEASMIVSHRAANKYISKISQESISSYWKCVDAYLFLNIYYFRIMRFLMISYSQKKAVIATDNHFSFFVLVVFYY